MIYRYDAPREVIARQIVTTINGGERVAVFRLWGPPGVGKTRLVHHVLGAAEMGGRVRFSQHVRKVRDWLTSPGRRLASDQILVVDEVPPVEAAALARDFRAVAPERARLIIIGPQDLAHLGGPPPVLLDRLDAASTRAILADEMGADDDRVDTVLELCGGYPLFAMWLGHALNRDPDLLRAPGSELTNNDDPWDATCAVLVGARSEDHEAWRVLAERRAKALVLACLLAERSWEGVGVEQEQQLADMLGLGWADLNRAAAECESRSLLRRGSATDLRYVSPANLERLVLNHFFGGSGPGQPPLDPRRLVRDIPEFFPALLSRAELVRASDACRRNLTNALFAELRDMVRIGDTPAIASLAEYLPLATHSAPVAALDAISGLFDDMGAQALAESPIAVLVSRSLKHVTHRNVGAREFARLESLLFELARLRRASYFGLGGEVWTQLFAAVHHLTRRPFTERFAILRRRLESGDADERAMAAAALGHVVNPRSISRTVEEPWDDVDGPWEHSYTLEPEHHARLRAGWSALLDACGDVDDAVSMIVREAIADNLRAGLSGGISEEHVEQLRALVPTWSAEERGRLAEQLDNVDRYEASMLRARPTLSASLAKLHVALEPVSLREKLIAQVGRWHPGPWPINATARHEREQAGDVELAREFVETAGAVADHFDWLCSDKAVRARQFARALGGQDRPMRLVSELHAAARDSSGHAFVAAYIAGWADSVGDRCLEAWLGSAAERVGEETLARALALIPGNDSRARMLIALVRSDEVPSDAFTGVGFFTHWSSEVSTTEIDDLLVALDERHDDVIVRDSVGLIQTRLERAPSPLSDRTRAAVHSLLARASHRSLPAIVGFGWAKSVVTLTKQGDLEPLAAALRYVAAPAYIGHAHHLVDALRGLTDAGYADLIWSSLIEPLDDEDAVANLAPVLEDSGLLAVDYAQHG
jgi:hypothetical protein